MKEGQPEQTLNSRRDEKSALPHPTSSSSASLRVRQGPGAQGGCRGLGLSKERKGQGHPSQSPSLSSAHGLTQRP